MATELTKAEYDNLPWGASVLVQSTRGEEIASLDAPGQYGHGDWKGVRTGTIGPDTVFVPLGAIIEVLPDNEVTRHVS